MRENRPSSRFSPASFARTRATSRIDGRPVVIHSPHDAFEHGLRFIHQEFSIVPTLSVAENIFLGRAYPRRLGILVDWNRLAKEAGVALGRLGISHIDPRRKMAQLGLGDQMLVRISSAFVDDRTAPARVYVMDEPTAALTGDEAERLFGVLNEIRKSGRSVLYVSHRLEEITRLCDRVTVFRDGASVGTRLVAHTSQDEMIRMMIGRAFSEAYPAAARGGGCRCGARRARPRKAQASHGIGFDVRRGEVLGIAGLAGAGQSEVLRLVMGAERARAGSIRVASRLVRPKSPDIRAGRPALPMSRASVGRKAWC